MSRRFDMIDDNGVAEMERDLRIDLRDEVSKANNLVQIAILATNEIGSDYGEPMMEVLEVARQSLAKALEIIDKKD